MQPDAKAQKGTWSYTNTDICINLNIGDDQDKDLSFASPGVDVLPCTVCTGLDRLRTRSMRRQMWIRRIGQIGRKINYRKGVLRQMLWCEKGCDCIQPLSHGGGPMDIGKGWQEGVRSPSIATLRLLGASPWLGCLAPFGLVVRHPMVHGFRPMVTP